jgi:hypothetical protein
MYFCLLPAVIAEGPIERPVRQLAAENGASCRPRTPSPNTVRIEQRYHLSKILSRGGDLKLADADYGSNWHPGQPQGLPLLVAAAIGSELVREKR